jgi:methylmalonyl-CoA mutase C-terminal domain/subunit
MSDEGRPIKILLGTLGMDQHETGAVAVSQMLRDAGMDVVYLGRFNLPPGIVEAALEEGADLIGLSCHSWEYLYYLDELFDLLRAQELDVPVVLGGSVITVEDARAVEARGVAATFGPGAAEKDVVSTIRRIAGRPPAG